jgi:hypothetical protein
MTLRHLDTWVWLVVAVVGGFALLGVLSGLLSRGRKLQLPYEKVRSLLTPTEISFYRVLQQAVSNDLQVCPKVRLADVVVVRKGTERYYTYFNPIAKKHLDFVLCDPQNFAPLLVIELDDASHSGEAAKGRDVAKDQALRAAKVPILRVRAGRNYQLAELRAAFDQSLYGSPASVR